MEIQSDSEESWVDSSYVRWIYAYVHCGEKCDMASQWDFPCGWCLFLCVLSTPSFFVSINFPHSKEHLLIVV